MQGPPLLDLRVGGISAPYPILNPGRGDYFRAGILSLGAVYKVPAIRGNISLMPLDRIGIV